jgi:hypothetical protein
MTRQHGKWPVSRAAIVIRFLGGRISHGSKCFTICQVQVLLDDYSAQDAMRKILDMRYGSTNGAQRILGALHADFV